MHFFEKYMDTKGIFAGILSELGLNTREFADSIGYSLTKLYDIQRGKTKRLGDDLVTLISEKYPKFNRVWLMTGEGDMLKPVVQEPAPPILSLLLHPQTHGRSSPFRSLRRPPSQALVTPISASPRRMSRTTTSCPSSATTKWIL